MHQSPASQEPRPDRRHEQICYGEPIARFFNTAGVCEPEDHYMLPPRRRLPDVDSLIDQKAYFVVHAPRQSGKTTCFHHLARELTASGKYAAVLTSCEVARTARDDVDRGVNAVLYALFEDARLDLPEELRPPSPETVAAVPPEMRFKTALTHWCERSPLPVALFLDEIDALFGKTLLSVLHQLRAGYRSRPQGFPQGIALIGLRDVRDYRIREVPGTPDHVMRELQEILGTSSPFNIKVESLTLSNFTAEEVAELYAQHTAETGQVFTREAAELAFGLTCGQPWLVNALARQVVMREAPNSETAVTAEHVEKAKEALILRRDTHIDSLVHRLREARIRRVVEPILAGEFPAEDLPEDDTAFVHDLGLVARGPSGLGIANPIYREVIPRALTSETEIYLPVNERTYVRPDGRLDFERLLDDFVSFWQEHAESFMRRQPYSEAAAQLVCMAYLQRVVNGGGYIDREYAVGSGRIDLCIRWPLADGTYQRFALELKVWREGRPDPLEKGLRQLKRYLERLSLQEGTLIIFDQRDNALPFMERGSRESQAEDDYSLLVLRL